MFYVFLANGFEETEALVPVDMLRRAGVDTVTVGVGGKYITGAHSITVEADITADNADINSDFEGIMLPGGMPGTANLSLSKCVREFIERAVSDSKLICAICAAPSVLGEMGVLKGKKAICFPGYEDKLKGAEISNESVCRDGNIITAKGAGVSLEFAFAVISYLKGSELSQKIKRQIQTNE